MDSIYDLGSRTYRLIVNAKDVTDEILWAAEDVCDYFTNERIDWEDFLDRLDGYELTDGTLIDMGNSTDSPAIRRIKKHVREYRSA